MPTRKDFRVDKCDDCIRITRTDVDGDLHTHIHSKKLAETIINNVCSEKIPLHSHSHTLESMKRLSDNEKYIRKINEITETMRKRRFNILECLEVVIRGLPHPLQYIASWEFSIPQWLHFMTNKFIDYIKMLLPVHIDRQTS